MNRGRHCHSGVQALLRLPEPSLGAVERHYRAFEFSGRQDVRMVSSLPRDQTNNRP